MGLGNHRGDRRERNGVHTDSQALTIHSAKQLLYGPKLLVSVLPKVNTSVCNLPRAQGHLHPPQLHISSCHYWEGPCSLTHMVKHCMFLRASSNPGGFPVEASLGADVLPSSLHHLNLVALVGHLHHCFT